MRDYLEVPLDGKGRIDEEGLVALRIGIVNKVIGEFPLSTDAKVLSEIVPQLGLREDDQTAVTVSLLTTPEVNETRESELPVEEVQPPDARQLGTGISMSVLIALEELLIKQLYGPRLREVGIMAVVGKTREASLLETAIT